MGSHYSTGVTQILSRIDVTNCALEVPIADFEHLPRELGCSLHRQGPHLALACEQPGCELHFEIEGDFAHLSRVDVKDDPHGRFLRDVVGLVMQIYSGDLDADLSWAEPSPHDLHLEFRNGETSHPLLFQSTQEPQENNGLAIDVSLPLIAQLLDDAQAAWTEYLRLKQSREKQTQSLT